MKYAAVEQLVIFLLFVIGSIVSSILEKRKKQQQGDPGKLSRPRPRMETPVPQWPKTAKNWQEELKRLLEGQLAPPPVAVPPKTTPPPAPRPQRPTPAYSTSKRVAPPVIAGKEVEISEGEMVLPSPLKESQTAYARAAQLDRQVGARLQYIDHLTETAKPAHVPVATRNAAAASVRRWTRGPQELREAFVASLIFGPPKSLEVSTPPLT